MSAIEPTPSNVRPYRPVAPVQQQRLGYVMLYSVNPFPVHLAHGTLGDREIPGKAKGEPYASLEVPDQIRKTYDGDQSGKGEYIYRDVIIEAESIVADFLGRYRYLGLFALPEGSDIEAERVKAEAMLKKSYLQAFSIADRLWQEKKDRSRISNLAHQACEALGRTAPWHEEPGTETMAPCPSCGTMIEVGRAKCRGCGLTLNARLLADLTEQSKKPGGVWAAAAAGADEA